MNRFALPVVLAASVSGLLSACDGNPEAELTCESLSAQVLAAQSVPTAQYVPCITEINEPWVIDATDTDQDRTEIKLQWLASDTGNERALVTLMTSCDNRDADPSIALAPSDVDVTRSTKNRTVTTYYEFQGGCVEASVTRPVGETMEALTTEDFTVELVPREDLNEYVLEQTNDSVGLDPDGEQ